MVAALTSGVEQPLLGIGRGGGGGVGVVRLAALVDLGKLLLDIGIQRGRQIVAGSLVLVLVGLFLGRLDTERRLLVTLVAVPFIQAVPVQNGRQHVLLGLILVRVGNSLVGKDRLVLLVVAAVKHLVDDQLLELLNGGDLLGVFLPVGVLERVGRVFGEVEAGLVILAVLLRVLLGDGVLQLLHLLLVVLVGKHGHLNDILHVALADALAHARPDVGGQRLPVGVGAAPQRLHVDIGNVLECVLVVALLLAERNAGGAGTLAVDEQVLRLTVSERIKVILVHMRRSVAARVVLVSREITEVIGVIAAQPVGVVHTVVVQALVNILLLLILQNLDLVLAQGVIIGFGGGAHASDDAEAVDDAVHQDERGNCQQNDQQNRCRGTFCLVVFRGGLIHE